MLETKSIYPGNSTSWKVGHDGASLAVNYTCRLRIIGTAVDRLVTTLVADDLGNADRAFLVALTPEETAGLIAGEHIVIIDIANITLGWASTQQASLVILTLPHVATDLDRLKAHRAALLDAKDQAIGGNVTRVRNGRFGNEMGYQTMSYEQICAAIDRVESEIAEIENAAQGRPRRGHVRLYWAG